MNTNNTEDLDQLFRAFLLTDTIEDMRQAVEKYPFLKSRQFLISIQQLLRNDVTPDDKPLFEKRVEWLLKVARDE
jgi:hypothetical protein